MSNVLELLRAIRQTLHCTVMPPCGMPTIQSGLALPLDVRTFYEAAGGVRLYEKGGWANRIVGPAEFVPADLVFWGEQTTADGPESAWYAVADVQDGNYLLIDLNPSRLGRCYDGFHETYRTPGYMAVVAESFTEMLERLYRQGNNQSYWLQDGFQSRGDAYDPLGG